jgi:MFS family permease
MLPRRAVLDVPAQVALGVGEEGSPPEAVVPAARTSLSTALASPAYRAALAGNFAVGFSVLGVRSTVVPLLVVKGLHLAPGWIGVAFVVAALVQGVLLLPAGKAVDEIGRRPMLVTGGFVTAGSLVGLAFVTGRVTLMAAMVVFAVGAAVMGVAPAAIVGDVVEGKGGTAVAVWQMSSDLGSVIGPVAAGVLIDHGSFKIALLVSAVVVFACTLPGLRVPANPSAVSTSAT